ncbi:hypothetical protein EDD16DRAFT_105657 [Pisolithus croceorrhizus]|nr:hypothetical protein EDD16DRAFT_105657 [Pisolithus croceorrhizus]
MPHCTTLVCLLVLYLQDTLTVDLPPAPALALATSTTHVCTHIRVDPAPALALVTLTTRVRTHIRVGPTAVIPAIPTTTGTAAHHHPHRDLHTRAYQKSRGMNPLWSGQWTCFWPPESPVYGHLVVVTCQPTREGCAAAAAHLSPPAGYTELVQGRFSWLEFPYCILIFFYEYIVLRGESLLTEPPAVTRLHHSPPRPTSVSRRSAPGPLANSGPRSTRRDLSIGILFVAVASPHLKISQFLGRQAGSYHFANIS